jgi:hypothetical protein
MSRIPNWNKWYADDYKERVKELLKYADVASKTHGSRPTGKLNKILQNLTSRSRNPTLRGHDKNLPIYNELKKKCPWWFKS